MNTGEQRISAIEVQEKRAGRRSIFLNGRFALGVDETVVADLGLHVGQVISEEELQAVVRKELLSKARQKALRLLEYRARSRVEIERRLAKAGYDEEIIADTITRLEELGFIDDARFSRSWVDHRLSGKPMGKTRIRWELRQKGISTDVVEEALSAVDADVEHKSALDVARRRWEKDTGPDERTRRRRLISYLQRQGFGWETINKVITELSEDAEHD